MSAPALAMRWLGSGGVVRGIRVTVRRNAMHLVFDPGFGLLIDLGFGHPGRVESRANADGDGPRGFQESLARPQFAGIVSHRYDLAADACGEIGAARLVALLLARCDTGAFRENNDVKALLQPFAALGDDLVKGILASRPVDGNHLHG